jgi:HPt (histidine-containing phosphotransfer) domain-containing protein
VNPPGSDLSNRRVVTFRRSRTLDDSQVLDLDHLRRQTAGDRALERELLTLFEAQSARLWPLIRDDGSPLDRADATHTLKGSARAIGAWDLASIAEGLEAALRIGEGETSVPHLIEKFEHALAAARQALAARNRASAA